jgi:hypothetical protein
MSRYEIAVIKRAFKLILGYVSPRRIRLTADRGFADDDLFELLQALDICFIIRVKGCVKVYHHGHWVKLNCLRFVTYMRHRDLGRISYCQRSPRRLWVTMSRGRNKGGHWGIWYLVSNRSLSARQAGAEYNFGFACEAGFKDAKCWLGFKAARVRDIRAWSRLFALFAIALLALTSLGMELLVRGDEFARLLLRRVISRRRGRCELSLITAMLSLVQQDQSLLECLSAIVKFNLDATL